MKARLFAIALLSTFSIPVWAHGGHGHFDGLSFWHYLTSPEHALPVLLMAGLIVILGRLWWKTSSEKGK